MKKMAILYICIGKYYQFFDGFYKSMEKYFLNDFHKEYFVFTDHEEKMNYERITQIYQENLGWPGNTLYRFKMFDSISEQLKSFDYIFFFNANYLCMKTISNEEFLPKKNGLVVTLHPGYYDSPCFRLNYDRNPKSKAYISYYDLRAKHYYCGGLNGGTTKEYLKLIKKIKKNIDIDDSKNIIAIYHDESHLNKYMLSQRNYKILDPGFAYPEEFDVPYEKKMFLIAKKNRFNVDRVVDYTGQNLYSFKNKFSRTIIYIVDSIKQKIFKY